MSKLVLLLEGLDCPHCAEKIESRVGDLGGVKSSNLDFINKKLTVEHEADEAALVGDIENLVHKLEPDVNVKQVGKSPANNGDKTLSLKLEGLDCPHCAEKIESRVGELEGVTKSNLDFINKKLTVKFQGDETALREEIDKCVHKLEPDVEIEDMAQSAERTLYLKLEDLDCPHCGEKIANRVGELAGVTASNVDFINKKLTVKTDGSNPDLRIQIEDTVHQLEPDVTVKDFGSTSAEPQKESGHKNDIIKLSVAVVFFIVSMLLDKLGSGDVCKYLSYGFAIAAYLIAGLEVVIAAVRNLVKGEAFDESLLMTIATVGAFALGDFREGAAVMLFFQIGELFQTIAVEKSRKSITKLMELKPESVTVVRDGKTYELPPEDIQKGEIIAVKTGDRVPLDGIITEGDSQLDTSALTGEFLPVEVGEGDSVLSGSTNLRGLLKIKVTNTFHESAVSKILDMVQNSSERKAKTEKFITRFSRVYTPAVVFAALALVFIPSFILGFDQFSNWLYRGLLFLVISCPCALVISVPLSFFAGIGGASKKGILIKGAKNLETMAQCKTLAVDKTGTLTKGKFTVLEVNEQGVSKDKLLETAAYCESMSTHPIGLSIVEYFGKEIDGSRLSDMEEIAGNGVKAKLDDKEVLCGKKALLENNGISVPASAESATAVYVALDGNYIGEILLGDEIKETSPKAVSNLRDLGVETVLLTGDKKDTAAEVAKKVGIKTFFSELLPENKVEKVEELINDPDRRLVAFAGDGINDAPVIARADIGIAMGGLGSDIAIEAADVVLMNDDPSSIADAVKISRKTMTIVKENIIFALGVKTAVLILGAVGLAGMWLAVFADVGVSVIAILNALRSSRTK
ncbi:heavy metal translocating P-type ATPase [Ruminococcus sp.]|uniref:heavy metal translocating P-type ATPase n=1 Tax=Ruminococcus sp. TaxID=41978 RepID=UPI0025EE811A|nr:heavy metal translocating P-type ATPase [Ruminococcus sp.]